MGKLFTCLKAGDINEPLLLEHASNGSGSKKRYGSFDKAANELISGRPVSMVGGSARERPLRDVRTQGAALYNAIVKRVEHGRDEACQNLSDRWWRISGASEWSQSGQDSQNQSYATYCSTKITEEDANREDIFGEALRVIGRDVPRTVPRTWNHESTARLISTAFEPDGAEADPKFLKFQASLTRVLQAFVVRNRQLGYCQGLNQIAAFLLAFMEEERAFWVLCTICENCRPRDYFASGSNAMGGFHVDSAIMVNLVKKRCKQLAKAVGINLDIIVNMAMFKGVETMFLMQVDLPCAIIFLDNFFLFGDAFLLSFLLHSIASAESEVVKLPKGPYFLEKAREAINSKIHSLAPKKLLKVLRKMKVISRKELEDLRQSEREAKAATWNKDGNLASVKLRKLAKYTNFSAPELKTLKENVSVSEEGVNKEQFYKILVDAGAAEIREFSDEVFNLFDEDASGKLDFRELAVCLSVLSRGTPDEKIRFMFSHYDKDSSGFLSYEEIVKMASQLETLKFFLEQSDVSVHGVSDFSRKITEARQDRIRSFLDLANQEGLLSFSEFSSRLQVDQSIMQLFSLDIEVFMNSRKKSKAVHS